MPTTVIHARAIGGKYHFGIGGLDHYDIQDAMVFHIDGDIVGDAPRSAPSPRRAPNGGVDLKVARAGYAVTEQSVGR